MTAEKDKWQIEMIYHVKSRLFLEFQSVGIHQQNLVLLFKSVL